MWLKKLLLRLPLLHLLPLNRLLLHLLLNRLNNFFVNLLKPGIPISGFFV